MLKGKQFPAILIMKLVKITSVYPEYIQKFYATRPTLHLQSYADQKAALDYDAFGWSDSWAHALGKLGYQVIELRPNIEALQRSWAKENDFFVGSSDEEPSTRMLSILKEQVVSSRPDILFIDAYDILTEAWVRDVKSECPNLQLTFAWCGAPFQDDSVFRTCDRVLSNIPSLVETFRAQGHRSQHLHHAFEPRILERIDLNTPKVDQFSFVGGIVRGKKFHQHREELLEGLVAQTNIQIYSPSAAMGLKDDLKTVAKMGAFGAANFLKAWGMSEETLMRLPVLKRAARWQSAPMFPVSRVLGPRLRPGVFGLEMYQVLRNSAATFNCHIDVAGHAASNFRLFEATGVGTCLLTDWKENITELFEPGTEIVTYRSLEECIEKARWLIDHPKDCLAIAVAGQKRTLREHTFELRAQRLDQLIKDWLKASDKVSG